MEDKMGNEQTAQDAETEKTEIDKSAIDSLAAALEAKDDIDDKETTDEKTGEKGEEKEAGTDKDAGTDKKEEAGEKEKDASDGKKTEEEQTTNQSDEVAELRSLLRSQKRELSLLKAKQSRVDKRTSKVIDEETGEEKDIEEELSPLETKIAAREELSVQRGAQLEILLESMAETKKWGDVKEVVTEGRVDEIIDTIAAHITKEQGGDLEENRIDTELSVWSIANPYKYMYDLIKQYHPDYAKKETEETKETKTDSAEKVKKKKEAVKTNDSIGGIKGGGDKSGWTSAKIDAMDEMDLGTVPRDVYDRYLRGELD
jgi:hypothetical protein